MSESVHKAVWLSTELMETTMWCAEQRQMRRTRYAVGAIDLLDAASDLRLGTQSLLLVEDEEIRLPSLSFADGPHPETMTLSLTQEKAERLAERSRESNMTQQERIRRSLRLANFLCLHGALPNPAFRNPGESDTIRLVGIEL
jgi:hypothetical protein